MSIYELNPYKISSLLLRYTANFKGFGIFGFSFGGEDTSTTSTTTTEQDIDRKKTTTTDASKTGKQATDTQQETELLGAEQRAELQQLFSNFAAQLGVPAGQERQTQEITNLLGAQAQKVASNEEDISAIIASREKKGTEEIGRQFTQLATGAGSSLNTVVQKQQAEATVDLQSELAATEAEIRLAAESGDTQQLVQILQGVAGAETAGVQQFATIAELLKGALAKQTGAEEVVSEEKAQSSEILEEIANAITKATGVSESETDSFSLGFKF